MNLFGRRLEISRRTVGRSCCLLLMLGIGAVFVPFLWDMFVPHSKPHASLIHIGELLEPALSFGNSAVLVDAYQESSWGPNGTSYYRVEMPRSNVEEFMQQEAVKVYWPKANAVADHLPLAMKLRWWHAYRCRNSRSWEGKGHRADLDVVITVCLDDLDLATVCLFVQSW